MFSFQWKERIDILVTDIKARGKQGRPHRQLKAPSQRLAPQCTLQMACTFSAVILIRYATSRHITHKSNRHIVLQKNSYKVELTESQTDIFVLRLISKRLFTPENKTSSAIQNINDTVDYLKWTITYQTHMHCCKNTPHG